LSLGDTTTDLSIKSLFADLEQVIGFINDNMPSDIVGELSDRMMPTISSRILSVWLENEVPSSLDDMINYQKSLAQVDNFASKLDSLDWPGADSLHDWVANAPRIWLNKRRETSLDWVRNHVALGLGRPQMAERTEKRMVGREDGNHISATGTLVTQDWDAAWDSGDEKEDVAPVPEIPNGSNNRHSLEEERNYTVSLMCSI
jgi:centromere/kinetochore protein ZW10